MKKILLLLLIGNNCFAQKDYTQLVNPFIGTGGHGHTYPGATSPFGAVQLSPDTRMADWDGSSGYHYSDSIIYGFSHTHLSGTGIPDYCDILLQPTIGKYEWNNKEYASPFSHKSEKANAGFYGVHLDKYNIDVELTTSTHAGLHKYIFSNDTKIGNIIIDLKHRDEVLDSHLEFKDDYTIVGYRFSKSWANNQKLFFAIKFNSPITKKEFHLTENSLMDNATSATGKGIQAGISFNVADNKTIITKCGISAVSIEGALNNLKTEVGEKSFEEILKENNTIWNKQLSKIKIESFAENNIDTTFYTALYHTMIVPNIFEDVDKKYRGTDDKIHTAVGFTNYTVFSLWDTYRAYHPLMSLIEKDRTLDWINTFLNQYKNGGMLPVWELSGNETFCMIGYHSIPVIVNAYKNGIRDFDKNLALEAMVSYSNSNRFGIKDYVKNGFLSNNVEAESVSKTMEYAYDDWCIAEFANMLVKPAIAATYYKRSKNYQNLFNPSTGFFQGKVNGAWYNPFNAAEVNNFYTEGNAWQYSLAAPHDINALGNLYGGTKEFTKHLDNLFTTKANLSGREQPDVTGLIGQYAHGNEPSHHIAYLFNYSNMPSNAAYYVNKICKEFYTNKPDGLIGNEDCGQMSAWYVWSCLGMYPVNPADTVLSIGSPQIKNAIIELGNGKQVKINVTKKNKDSFIPELINDYNEISINDLLKGTTIEFTLSDSYQLRQYNADKFIELDNHFVPVPFIVNNKNKFSENLKVELKSIKKSVIKYQITTTENYNLSNFVAFTKSFTINKNCYVHFLNIANKDSSKVVSQPFYKIKNDKTINVLTPVNPMYTAGGNESLIDGIKGSTNWRAGEWQSYHGNNFEAIVHFKKISTINSVTISFLQDIKSWIWAPRNIKIYTSNDGINFKEQTTFVPPINEKDENITALDFVIPLQKIKARFVKIVAENFAQIPSWHIGAGDKAHIFISEIEFN